MCSRALKQQQVAPTYRYRTRKQHVLWHQQRGSNPQRGALGVLLLVHQPNEGCCLHKVNMLATQLSFSRLVQCRTLFFRRRQPTAMRSKFHRKYAQATSSTPRSYIALHTCRQGDRRHTSSVRKPPDTNACCSARNHIPKDQQSRQQSISSTSIAAAGRVTEPTRCQKDEKYFNSIAGGTKQATKYAS